MQIKTHCAYCKEFFIANTSRAMYCSDHCRVTAWRKRSQSPIMRAVKALQKAKVNIFPSGEPCPICGRQLTITDGTFTLCQKGHIWSYDGYQSPGTGTEKQLYDYLVERVNAMVSETA